MTEPLTAESEALLADLIAAFSGDLSTPDTMDALIRPALAAIEAAARAEASVTAEALRCPRCESVRLRYIPEEYEPAHLLCDDCGWDTADLIPAPAPVEP